jgi:hypothetical protein
MRVASDATLARAARLREGGKSWLELTRSEETRRTGLRFFAGGRAGERKEQVR